jgi:hypothetical protein
MNAPPAMCHQTLKSFNLAVKRIPKTLIAT